MPHGATPFAATTPLRALIRLAIPICRRAEAGSPSPGPGRPVEIPERAVAVMILIALAKRLPTESSQSRSLPAHAAALAGWLGLDRFPARRTDVARYRTASRLRSEAVAVHAAHAAARGRIDVRGPAADKSLVAAAGPVWHDARRARGARPGGAGAEARGSRSAHDGGVDGYALGALVTAPRRGVIRPVLASVDPGHLREAGTFPAKVPRLPAGTRYVLVDMGGDSTQVLAALAPDQILLAYNRIRGHDDAEVKWILDLL